MMLFCLASDTFLHLLPPKSQNPPPLSHICHFWGLGFFKIFFFLIIGLCVFSVLHAQLWFPLTTPFSKLWSDVSIRDYLHFFTFSKSHKIANSLGFRVRRFFFSSLWSTLNTHCTAAFKKRRTLNPTKLAIFVTCGMSLLDVTLRVFSPKVTCKSHIEKPSKSQSKVTCPKVTKQEKHLKVTQQKSHLQKWQNRKNTSKSRGKSHMKMMKLLWLWVMSLWSKLQSDRKISMPQNASTGPMSEMELWNFFVHSQWLD